MPDAGPHPEPFTPVTDSTAIEDLRARLRATRWPDAPEEAGWSLGTDLGYLRDLVAYWADGFDWPAQEAALNRLPRFRVPLGESGDPLRASPGSADTVCRPVACRWSSATAGPTRSGGTRRSIPLLTDPGAHGADPADAFDVVVPDMPGFGYSERPRPAAGLHRASQVCGRS